VSGGGGAEYLGGDVLANLLGPFFPALAIAAVIYSIFKSTIKSRSLLEKSAKNLTKRQIEYRAHVGGLYWASWYLIIWFFLVFVIYIPNSSFFYPDLQIIWAAIAVYASIPFFITYLLFFLPFIVRKQAFRNDILVGILTLIFGIGIAGVYYFLFRVPYLVSLILLPLLLPPSYIIIGMLTGSKLSQAKRLGLFNLFFNLSFLFLVLSYFFLSVWLVYLLYHLSKILIIIIVLIVAWYFSFLSGISSFILPLFPNSKRRSKKKEKKATPTHSLAIGLTFLFVIILTIPLILPHIYSLYFFSPFSNISYLSCSYPLNESKLNVTLRVENYLPNIIAVRGGIVEGDKIIGKLSPIKRVPFNRTGEVYNTTVTLTFEGFNYSEYRDQNLSILVKAWDIYGNKILPYIKELENCTPSNGSETAKNP